MWTGQIEILRQHVRVIAYDIRGHGGTSAGADEYTLSLFTHDLFHFMDSLQIEKATLCGLSMGGYIALYAVEQHPTRLSGLILCDTQCLADDAETKKKRFQTISSIEKDGLRKYASDSIKKLFATRSLLNKRNMVSFIERTILHTPKETICNTLKALANRKETCSRLHLIDVPVFIIVGSEDAITPPKLSIQMQEKISGSLLYEINNAGHLSNLEFPDRFNSYLLRFIKLIG